ncbi:ribosomal protein L18 [Candidatus Endolissoclinum faulkneri L5]|uniref:Large ribosomal subunit protein uL18 n=1 Tax=Candidatus Endolissoclinum faulkneri L5 TaxID=1401328 RepID=V9TR50_9PROT|nr:50S ribosomal protein L18 [Candidatus Endolissoclinum faulkneri]AHC73369.1 ribosomal protein L18 [Candidatus Endolissoclinum faulkneri L5]
MLSATEMFKRRKMRNRAKINRSAGDRKRLSVFRSSKNIYAQIINLVDGNTVVSASSIDKELKSSLKTGADKAAAQAVGRLLALRGIEKGLHKVVFDRGGYMYHGRVKSLADAARKFGLRF